MSQLKLVSSPTNCFSIDGFYRTIQIEENLSFIYFSTKKSNYYLPTTENDNQYLPIYICSIFLGQNLPFLLVHKLTIDNLLLFFVNFTTVLSCRSVPCPFRNGHKNSSFFVVVWLIVCSIVHSVYLYVKYAHWTLILAS